MSSTENVRKVQPKSGKPFPKEPRYDDFVAAIAAALKAEYEGKPGSVKAVGRLTHRNERAVRNWFEGRHGPSAENLVQLIRHSDHVLNAVLHLSGRTELAKAGELLRFREDLRGLLQSMDGPPPS